MERRLSSGSFSEELQYALGEACAALADDKVCADCVTRLDAPLLSLPSTLRVCVCAATLRAAATGCRLRRPGCGAVGRV